jgi:hypothetical protein
MNCATSMLSTVISGSSTLVIAKFCCLAPSGFKRPDRVAFFLVSRRLVNFAIGLFCPTDFRPQSKPPGGVKRRAGPF